MKAFIYKYQKSNKNFICSKFDNSTERVTIFHNEGGIYQQYLQQGEVKYESVNGALSDTVPSQAVQSMNDVGHIISHVWRPGLCLYIQDALEINQGEKSRAKRELKILIEKLHEVLMYIEPDINCLQTFGHKIRELLILACTECENSWTSYIRHSGNTNERLSTNDYVKLNNKLFLSEYRVVFTSHPITINLQPFVAWDIQNPTSSLIWYDGYNKTKHNKDNFFNLATLENCLNAIAANIIMFCVRYSPCELIESNDICSNLINEYFSIELSNPDLTSFYIPYIKRVEMASGAFSASPASTYEQKWIIDDFVL